MHSQAVDVCGGMLRLGVEAQVKHGLTDMSLYEELQYSYWCRLINMMTVHVNTRHSQVLPIFEMGEPKVLIVIVLCGCWCGACKRMGEVGVSTPGGGGGGSIEPPKIGGSSGKGSIDRTINQLL